MKEKLKNIVGAGDSARPQKRNTQKGITLVALVITIIVLLILAMVSISIVMNQGIMTKSKEAADKYNEAANNEQEELTFFEKLFGKYNGENIEEIPEEEGPTLTDEEMQAVLQSFTENPQNYVHPEQSSTNKDRAIGTDGQAVNLDLWEYIVLDEENSEIALSNRTFGCDGDALGYSNDNIVDGKIKGTVPQYIYVEEKNKVYEVTSMVNTFIYCTNLKYAPKIPTTIRILNHTFYGCTNLTQTPAIPSSVTDMNYTFMKCTSLTQAPVIPSSVTNMNDTFYNCTSLTGTVRINASNVGNAWGCFGNITNNITVRLPANSTTYNAFNTDYGSSSNIKIETF